MCSLAFFPIPLIEFFEGLLAGLFTVVAELPAPSKPASMQQSECSERDKSTRHSNNLKKMNDTRDDSCLQPDFSATDEFPLIPSPGWVSAAAPSDTIRTPKRRDLRRKKDVVERPTTPSLVKHSSDQKDNFLGRPSHQWATSDFVEWDEAFSEMPMDNIHSNVNMTIDVKPLPKLRLDLMPAPREEDEDNISSI